MLTPRLLILKGQSSLSCIPLNSQHLGPYKVLNKYLFGSNEGQADRRMNVCMYVCMERRVEGSEVEMQGGREGGKSR